MTHITRAGYDKDSRKIEGDKSHLHSRRGQSSIIILLVVIMMFVGVVVFLLNLAGTVNREEFTNLYVNNLLLSVMRTDTGYTDSNCKLVSDLVFCAYFTPEWECGGKPCLRLANETVQGYMALFGNETKSMRYLFTVTPEFAAFASGEPISLDIGDASLKSSKDSVKRYSYPLVISKAVGMSQHTLKVQLAVAKK